MASCDRMPRMIDQIRASKLPSNMMQFAARGALAVSAAENIEIMVYLARHNKVFGDLARMTLAGWDEKASLAAASDPNTPREVLDYFISPDNLRPKLLPALVENPSVSEGELAKFAISASREAVEAMLQSPRVRASAGILDSLKANPYLKANELNEVTKLTSPASSQLAATSPGTSEAAHQPVAAVDLATESDAPEEISDPVLVAVSAQSDEPGDVADEEVSAYLAEHAAEIAAEPDKPFQAMGVVDLLGPDYFPVSAVAETESAESGSSAAGQSAGTAAVAKPQPQPKTIAHVAKARTHGGPDRENTLQKINRLDVKGRIQLALKGNKEERSILIRDGTKVVSLAVLDAPKLSDGEVEKFASQKNVLEAVLRTIPLKRRFMKNYIVVRNLVANPRTPLDISLGLMKNLLVQDLKNLSSNKEISETVRKLALKMFKQKLEAANKK